MRVRLILGDCLKRLPDFEDGTFSSVLCDPPYDLTAVSRGGSPRVFVDNPAGRTRIGTDRDGAKKGFMGKTWDGTGIAFSVELWSEVFRVLESGGEVKAFGGTRTFHRMAVAMEEAGFIDVHIDAWTYGSGFPKSLNVSKAIDKLFGAKRKMKRIEATGGKVLEYGGQNSRPWMEEMAKKGYREAPGDEPVTEKAKLWDGWGTALKPAWEPILVGRRP
jgi:site-specific DNA-methyltransferase (adenine-specific)